MSPRGYPLALVFLAGLLLAAGAQAEEQIYKWMDEKGQIHFTATPPPRNARPIPSKPQEKKPIQVVPAPQTSRPTSIAPTLVHRQPSAPPARPNTAARAPEPVECHRYEGPLSRVEEAQRAVNGAEQAIERLENDPVSDSVTHCTDRSYERGTCGGERTYNRAQALEEARERLQAAEDRLADAEGDLRAAGVPRECLNRN